MNDKFKKFLCLLAVGAVSVGTAGLLSACGNDKKDEPKQPETPGEQQPVVANEVAELRTVLQTVTSTVNNLINPQSSATVAAQNVFYVRPLAATAPTLDQTLLGYISEVGDDDRTADAMMVKMVLSGAVVQALTQVDAYAQVLANANQNKIYNEILTLPTADETSYLRVNKNGQVWTVEQSLLSADGKLKSTATIEINLNNTTNNFKVRTYGQEYNVNGEPIEALNYGYVDSAGNCVVAMGDNTTSVQCYYGQSTNDGYQTWQITSTTVQEQCQTAIKDTLATVEYVDLSQANPADDYKFSADQMQQVTDIMNNQGGATENPETPETPETPEHTTATVWSKDNTYHWHACTVDGCTDAAHVQDKAAHVYDSTTHLCVCGAQDPDTGSQGGETENPVVTEADLVGSYYVSKYSLVNERVNYSMTYQEYIDGKQLSAEQAASADYQMAYGYAIVIFTNLEHVYGLGGSMLTLNNDHTGTMTGADCTWSFTDNTLTISINGEARSTQLKDGTFAFAIDQTGNQICTFAKIDTKPANPNEQRHQAVTEWTHDEWQHWHACAVDGCGNDFNRAEHVYDQKDGTECVCGAVKPVENHIENHNPEVGDVYTFESADYQFPDGYTGDQEAVKSQYNTMLTNSRYVITDGDTALQFSESSSGPGTVHYHVADGVFYIHANLDNPEEVNAQYTIQGETFVGNMPAPLGAEGNEVVYITVTYRLTETGYVYEG